MSSTWYHEKYKLTHTPTTVVQVRGEGGVNEPSSWLSFWIQSEIYLNWKDSHKLIPFLLVMTLYDVKWGAFDPQSQIRHFGFHYFLKKSRNKGNYRKSSQNSCEMHKYMKFCYLMKWTKKNTKLSQNSWFLVRHTLNLMLAIATSKQINSRLTFINLPPPPPSPPCTPRVKRLKR